MVMVGLLLVGGAGAGQAADHEEFANFRRSRYAHDVVDAEEYDAYDENVSKCTRIY